MDIVKWLRSSIIKGRLPEVPYQSRKIGPNITSIVEASETDCAGEGESQIFDGVKEVSQTLTPERLRPKTKI